MKEKSTNNTFTVAGILIQIYISSQIQGKDKPLIRINTIKAILFFKIYVAGVIFRKKPKRFFTRCPGWNRRCLSLYPALTGTCGELWASAGRARVAEKKGYCGGERFFDFFFLKNEYIGIERII